MQETRVHFLVQEDPTGCRQLSPGTTTVEPVICSSCAANRETHALQSLCSATREAITVRSPSTASKTQHSQKSINKAAESLGVTYRNLLVENSNQCKHFLAETGVHFYSQLEGRSREQCRTQGWAQSQRLQASSPGSWNWTVGLSRGLITSHEQDE